MVALEDCDHGVGKERHQCVEQLGNNLPTLWNRRRVGELPLDMLLSSGLAVSDDVDLLRIFRNPGGEGSKWQNSHYFTCRRGKCSAFVGSITNSDVTSITEAHPRYLRSGSES